MSSFGATIPKLNLPSNVDSNSLGLAVLNAAVDTQLGTSATQDKYVTDNLKKAFASINHGDPLASQEANTMAEDLQSLFKDPSNQAAQKALQEDFRNFTPGDSAAASSNVQAVINSVGSG